VFLESFTEGNPMSYPLLQQYLERLSSSTGAASSISLDAQGRAQGRFFNCTMSSAFQPVRHVVRGEVLGYEGLARSVAAADEGLSLWKLLDHAASDDESVELDRLCRMLHAINFFRQSGTAGPDLFLNVHDRLLSAVSSNHGHAFRRILDALELPLARVVLQLPPTSPQQGWLLNYVADNYRRNGFRFALQATTPAEARQLLEKVRPNVLRIDARELPDLSDLSAVLQQAREAQIPVVFKRLESVHVLHSLRTLAEAVGGDVRVQGYLLDAPRAALLEEQPDAGIENVTRGFSFPPATL
jgi:EAL domain-containing protein (putative c-di-GMP-specific phosphodiesterase class I)